VSRYHDDRTHASNPGRVRLSRERLLRLEPASAEFPDHLASRYASREEFEEMLAEHLAGGDSRAACVVTLRSFLVAAYTDELDCIVLLRFPRLLATEHGLQAGDRLLTVNTYARGTRFASDLVPGTRQLGRWVNFYPVIAEFLSEDKQRIERRKAEIAESEWRRCAAMGVRYLREFPGRWRNGSPFWSVRPAT
jgi:hypothetical protein